MNLQLFSNFSCHDIPTDERAEPSQPVAQDPHAQLPMTARTASVSRAQLSCSAAS